MKNNENDKGRILNNIVSSANGKIDREMLQNAVKSNNADALINSLDKKDKEKLKSIMSDKASMEALLKSPEAQAFMKKGGKNG